MLVKRDDRDSKNHIHGLGRAWRIPAWDEAFVGRIAGDGWGWASQVHGECHEAQDGWGSERHHLDDHRAVLVDRYGDVGWVRIFGDNDPVAGVRGFDRREHRYDGDGVDYRVCAESADAGVGWFGAWRGALFLPEGRRGSSFGAYDNRVGAGVPGVGIHGAGRDADSRESGNREDLRGDVGEYLLGNIRDSVRIDGLDGDNPEFGGDDRDSDGFDGTGADIV